MKHKDDRLKLLNDILNGIRILKFYGWESSMQRMVSKIRHLEMKEILKNQIVDAITLMFFDSAPFLASIVTFYGYIVIDGQILTPKTAFVTLYLFDLIRLSVYLLPRLVISTVTTSVSMRRVLKFLNEPEREIINVEEFKDEVDEFLGKRFQLNIRFNYFSSRNQQRVLFVAQFSRKYQSLRY